MCFARPSLQFQIVGHPVAAVVAPLGVDLFVAVGKRRAFGSASLQRLENLYLLPSLAWFLDTPALGSDYC